MAIKSPGILCRGALALVMLMFLSNLSAYAGDSAVAAPRDASAEKSDSGQSAEKETSEIFAEIRLTGGYPEGAQLPGLFGTLTESLDDALTRLEKAVEDDRIAGVILKFDNPGELQLDWSTAYAFRRAINEVREAGKPVYAWLTMADSPGYLVASACDRIYMPKSGALMVLGLRAEVTFYKTLFDRLDINPEMLRVGKFKSAAEPYTRTEMSPEFRKEMEELLDDLYGAMVTAIAKGRELDRAQVETAIDSGPLAASAAQAAELIDGFAYEDEIEESIAAAQDISEAKIARKYAKEKRDTDFSGLDGFLKFMDLLAGIDPDAEATSGPKIAVVYASGAIMSGESQSGLFSGTILGSETLTKAIDTARDDDDVKAIVLRINSPGGSALASDIIWRSVELAQQEKPVLVSMGGVAASGGYYIAMGADTIVAEPTTITGSIGVVGGKLAFGGLLDKIGITTSVISRGQNSGTLSLLTGFSESERAALQKMLDDIYRQFTSKAAQGRDMPLEELKKLAGGRIYSGTRAKELGLVDKIGSLEDTIELAKQQARKQGLLEENEEINIQVLPKAKSPLEQLFGPLGNDAALQQTSGLSAWAATIDPRLAELLSGAEMIRMLARERVLMMMPFQIRVR